MKFQPPSQPSLSPSWLKFPPRRFYVSNDSRIQEKYFSPASSVLFSYSPRSPDLVQGFIVPPGSPRLSSLPSSSFEESSPPRGDQRQSQPAFCGQFPTDALPDSYAAFAFRAIARVQPFDDRGRWFSARNGAHRRLLLPTVPADERFIRSCLRSGLTRLFPPSTSTRSSLDFHENLLPVPRPTTSHHEDGAVSRGSSSKRTRSHRNLNTPASTSKSEASVCRV